MQKYLIWLLYRKHLYFKSHLTAEPTIRLHHVILLHVWMFLFSPVFADRFSPNEEGGFRITVYYLVETINGFFTLQIAVNLKCNQRPCQKTINQDNNCCSN